ncbi:Transcriptional regulatory protein DegU [subsurface metagenome]
MSKQIEKKTTILLADDQLMVRQGIRLLLEREADFEVVGEADNTLEAVKLAHELKPDVVVIQARRPSLGGVECIRQLKAEHPQTAVLILTMYDEEEYVAELLRAGAAGHLLKTARTEDLAQAIRSVRAGDFICNVDLAQRLLKRAARAQPVALDYGQHLTRRESEVLKLVTRMSNHDIADQLGLTERTVKGHLTNIFQKMNVGSRTEAVLEALKRGWLTTEDT